MLLVKGDETIEKQKNTNEVASNCPLCEQDNLCAQLLKNNMTCWCQTYELVTLSPNLEQALMQLQANQNNIMTYESLNSLQMTRRCVCQTCLIKLNQLATAV